MNGTMRQDLSILDTLEPTGSIPAAEDARMSEHPKSRWNKSWSNPRSRGRKRRPRRDRNAAYGDDEFPDEPSETVDVPVDTHGRVMTSDEREYHDARVAAEDRAELLIDAGKMGAVVILLWIFVGPLGFIAMIFWLVKYARRLFSMMVEPRLRERLVEEEVQRNVHANVTRERREIADDHAHSLEVLSASVAHEIRNPITAAKSLLQQMREDPDSVDNEEYAQVALVELERVERSISHLLRFGREEEFHKTTVLMRDVLDSALETFRERSEREGVAIRREFDSDGELLGDAEKLRRVMINLVGNALDALADANVEDPAIDVSMGENLAGNEVWVRIRDNGLGIDSETQSQIFTPFYTDKRNGTGLGLAITKKLVDVHQGHIEVSAAAGQGAEFVLRFPKREAGHRSRSAFEGDSS